MGRNGRRYFGRCWDNKVRPGRPKKHVHNWERRFPLIPYEFTRVENNRFTNFGLRMPYLPYWACIRGHKVKHIRHDNLKPTTGYYGDPYMILGSGFIPEELNENAPRYNWREQYSDT